MSKKRKLDLAEVDHQAERKATNRTRARPAKKPKLSTSSAMDGDQTSVAASEPNSAIKNELPKSRQTRKKRKKGVKRHPPDKAIDEKNPEVSERVENAPIENPTRELEQDVNLDPSQSTQPAQSVSHMSEDRPAVLADDERPDRASPGPGSGDLQQPPVKDALFKLRRKEAKKARRRAAREAKEASEAREAKEVPNPQSSLSNSSPDKDNLQAVTTSDVDEEPPNPQDFQSPMIQSV